MSPSCACPAAPEPLKVPCVSTYPWATERTVWMLFTDTSCEDTVPPTPHGCLSLMGFELRSPKKEQCMVPAQAVT